MVGPDPRQMGNHKYNPDSMNCTFPKAKYYLSVESKLNLNIPKEQVILNKLSDVLLFSIWCHCYRILGGTQKWFFSLPLKESMQEGDWNFPKKGMGKVFALWRMWKSPDPAREWNLRDWQRGGVAGSKGAWTHPPPSPLQQPSVCPLFL